MLRRAVAVLGLAAVGTIEFTLEDSTDIVMGEAQVITQ